MVDSNQFVTGIDAPLPEIRLLNDSPTDGITSLRYLPPNHLGPSSSSSDLLASTSWDGHVRVHDTSLRSCMLKYNMHSGPLLSLSVLSDVDKDPSPSTSTSSLVTGGCDGTIRKLDIETSVETTIGRHTADISDTNRKNDNDTNAISSTSSSIACSCLASISNSIVVSAGWHKQLHVWDIRTSSTNQQQPATTVPLPGKAFSMDIDPKQKKIVVVATSGRRTCFIDLRYPTHYDTTDNYNASTGSSIDASLLIDRESSLKYQTRCIRFFPDGNSIVLGSIEGRAAVEYLEDIHRSSENQQAQKNFAFKCHRVNDMVYPVNAITCHPLYGTFVTGGCDGTVVFWDVQNKKKITSLPSFPTAISALAYNMDGTEIAIASSYTYEEGEREHPKDEIYIRRVLKSECTPKVKS